MSIRRAQDERLEGTPDGLNAITEIMDVPDAPTIGTATDLGTGSTASVTFTAATTGGTATTYTVTSTPGSITGTGASSPITVSGLSPSVAYTFKVKGTNATGVIGPESVASNSLTLALPVDSGYDSLASVTVPSGGLSSITFSGIPSGYVHLEIRALARTDRASNPQDILQIRYNGDTTTAYSYHTLNGNGTSAAGSDRGTSTANPWSGIVAASTAGANVFGSFIATLLDYTNTNKYKTLRNLSGIENNDTNGRIYFSSNLWMNTSAVTSINIAPVYGTNFVEFSSFALYGVK